MNLTRVSLASEEFIDMAFLRKYLLQAFWITIRSLSVKVAVCMGRVSCENS